MSLIGRREQSFSICSKLWKPQEKLSQNKKKKKRERITLKKMDRKRGVKRFMPFLFECAKKKKKVIKLMIFNLNHSPEEEPPSSDTKMGEHPTRLTIFPLLKRKKKKRKKKKWDDDVADVRPGAEFRQFFSKRRNGVVMADTRKLSRGRPDVRGRSCTVSTTRPTNLSQFSHKKVGRKNLFVLFCFVFVFCCGFGGSDFFFFFLCFVFCFVLFCFVLFCFFLVLRWMERGNPLLLEKTDL